MPPVPGVYRIRCRRHRGLIYIGLTHTSLVRRLRGLNRAITIARAGKPPARHTAGQCVLDHLERGHHIDVSWIEVPNMDVRERYGIEAELIGAYRKRTGKNPTCQFAGVLPPRHM